MRIPDKRNQTPQQHRTTAPEAKRSRNGRGGIHQRHYKQPFSVASSNTDEGNLHQMQLDAINDAAANVQQPTRFESETPIQQALQLWLSWNEAYEKATACMFESGKPVQRVERLMDQIDAARQEAVRLSESLSVNESG